MATLLIVVAVTAFTLLILGAVLMQDEDEE